MSNVYFKASLQNTLNPEVGTFDNVKNKEGTFILEDGEYYLTNNTSNSYGVYYPTKDIYSVGFTIEFDLNYPSISDFEWCLAFNGDDGYWFGIGVYRTNLEFRGDKLSDYHLITSPNTWLHVKCIFDYDHNNNKNYIHIYIDNVEVNKFTISKNYGIKYIDILGNSGGFASTAKIKNIIIYSDNKHYLDTTGLTSFWSKIKSLFATKTELASKANISDLSTVAASGDYNDLINKPDISKLDDMDEYGSLHVTRDTDGNFFVFTHNSWSASPVNAWGGMYFRTSDDHNVFGFAARQSSFPFEKFSVGNNGYLRGYDTDGHRTVTLTINGGTAGQPDTQNITVDGTFVNAGDQKPYSANMYTIGTPDMPYKAIYAGTFEGNLSPSAIRAQWYAAYPDGAEAHNSMWGGRDITAAFDAGTVSANIANGTFRDIFPGDYITKQVTIPQVLADDGTTVLFAGGTYTVNWVIADCDYWINKGDQGNGMTAHHVVIVPQVPIFSANMNATNTTEGGYAGSRMYMETIPACATGIVNAFGADHILTFRDLITNTVDNNVASKGYCGWTGASAPWGVWVSAQCNLMTEHMVTGAPHCSSSGIDDEITTRQMSAFRLSERLINYNRQHWWMRNVVSSAYFVYVNGGGAASADNASTVYGVRPFALLN